VTERHSIAEARRNFLSLVHDAENGKAVEITRRGEPVAVLIGLSLTALMEPPMSGLMEPLTGADLGSRRG
jgi:prevent-host-death family protein